MPRPDVPTLLSIATFIQARGTTTFAEIAEHFSLSVDDVIPAVTAMYMTETSSGQYFLDVTIDVEDDDDEAIDVVYHPTDVITALDHSDVPSIYLTAGEAVVACHLLDRVLGIVEPDAEPAQTLRELRHKLSKAARGGGVNVPEPAVSQASRRTLTAMWRALREGRHLEVTYHKPDDTIDTPERVTITPAGIASYHRTYLGSVTGPKKLKWYRLDRMSDAEVTGPVDATHRDRGRRAFKNHDIGNITGQTVTLRTTRAGRWLAESLPHAVLRDHDSELEIELSISSLAWLRYTCLMLGDDLLDISPPEVRTQIRESAAEILRAQRDFRPGQ